ncbi:unnamed protein product [Rotaria sordida]|uniref:Uncharacterized protein n=1 Tax=Rotaria sordida TaxID=392033 RepID=A0A819GZD0_9BILA|nr:unnamed protein product [Rotaria sordida]
MYPNHRLRFWSFRNSLSEPLYSYDVDNIIEPISVRDLWSKHLHQEHLLPSDIYCRSNTYKPTRSWPISTRYHSFNTYHFNDIRPILPRPISPVEFPRISLDHYRPLFFCKNCCHYDFSNLNLYNREPSFFPLAHNYYRLQTDYERFHTNKIYTIKRINLKQRWKIYGLIIIFYFMLKKNLRLAKQKDTYYHRDYHRIRFLELLTAVHRVYLEPYSSIHKALSYVVNSSSKLLNEEQLFHCVRTIINEITSFLPSDGILGTNSDESVLIYLLNCSLEQYPSTYFWSIERHLLLISYSKMKEHGFLQLDHFTSKFLLISTFIFHCLIKTLLLKPVKFRLIRGQLNRTQWLNIRLLSTLILYIARHAVLYKEQNHLPMPFPFEMKNYLMKDEKLKEIFKHIEQLIESTTPKLSSWACEYSERLQRHMRTMKTRSQKNIII